MKRTAGFTPCGDRYAYDFRLCLPAKGWAQLDTKQDAWYYGNWINPLTLETVSYAEGDATHIKYDDEAEFVRGVGESLAWHTEHGWEPKIDGMCRPEIIEAFTRMGFAPYLH